MKKSDLRKIIKEEVQKVLKENFKTRRISLPGGGSSIFVTEKGLLFASKQDLEQVQSDIGQSIYRKLIPLELLMLDWYVDLAEYRKLNRELQETVEPSDFLKRKFPDVIEYDKNKVGSDINWMVVTTDTWKYDRAAEFQEAAGYHSMGYGGPYEFKLNNQEGNKFTYTWHCAASSN